MTKENEEMQNDIDEYEKEKQRKKDCGEYHSDTSSGITDYYLNLHSNEDKLKDIDIYLKNLNNINDV